MLNIPTLQSVPKPDRPSSGLPRNPDPQLRDKTDFDAAYSGKQEQGDRQPVASTGCEAPKEREGSKESDSAKVDSLMNSSQGVSGIEPKAHPDFDAEADEQHEFPGDPSEWVRGVDDARARIATTSSGEVAFSFTLTRPLGEEMGGASDIAPLRQANLAEFRGLATVVSSEPETIPSLQVPRQSGADLPVSLGLLSSEPAIGVDRAIESLGLGSENLDDRPVEPKRILTETDAAGRVTDRSSAPGARVVDGSARDTRGAPGSESQAVHQVKSESGSPNSNAFTLVDPSVTKSARSLAENVRRRSNIDGSELATRNPAKPNAQPATLPTTNKHLPLANGKSLAELGTRNVIEAFDLQPVSLSETEAPQVWESRTPASTPFPHGLIRADTPRMIGRQMAEALHRLPGGPVEISLNPEEPGKVRLNLLAGESGITVHVLAERSETLDLMRRHIDQLARELQSLGYENIAFGFAEGKSQNNHDHAGNKNPQSSSANPLPGKVADPEMTRLSLGATSGLDLRL